MSNPCVIKLILHDRVDSNELPIEALHASSIHLMTHFVIQPSSELADAIVRMLFALSSHKDRYTATNGMCVYAQAACAWRSIVERFDMGTSNPRSATYAVH